MTASWSLSVVSAFLGRGALALLFLHTGQGQDAEQPGKVIQSMKIEAPIMTEEDQHGYNMPDRYLCDACKAVVYHLNQTLVKRQPRGRRLKEWEYTELFDEVCVNEFEGYGIKLVDGQNVLSGPGLKQKEEEMKPGVGGAMIQMGGDNWKKRMAEICRRFVYDKVGEDELYDSFHASGELTESMCFQVTRDCDSSRNTQKPKQAKKPKKSSESPLKKETGAQKKRVVSESAPSSSTTSTAKEPQSGIVKGKPRPAPKTDKRPVDVTYFLAQLAVQHGLPPKDYTRSRTREQWEKTMLALAGRIFGQGEEGSEEPADDKMIEV